MTIWTVGHSTLTAAAFVELLEAHAIKGVADVRAIPASRRHPHFGQQALSRLLAEHGIEYRHVPELGGHRRPRPDSPNGAWRQEAFRGYADHLGTSAFRSGLQRVLDFASRFAVSVLCAERRWKDCHRQLIADVLIVGGHEVRHIMNADEAEPHQLSRYARVSGAEVTYPSLV